MKKFHGGHPVGRGAYGHVRDARMIALQDGEILPGLASGDVKVRSNVEIAAVHPHSVTLTDGSTLPADVIVYGATPGGSGARPGLRGRAVGARSPRSTRSACRPRR